MADDQPKTLPIVRTSVLLGDVYNLSMDAIEARFRAAIELREAMIAMQRQLLIREHPSEACDRIDQRLAEWVIFREAPQSRKVGLES